MTWLYLKRDPQRDTNIHQLNLNCHTILRSSYSLAFLPRGLSRPVHDQNSWDESICYYPLRNRSALAILHWPFCTGEVAEGVAPTPRTELFVAVKEVALPMTYPDSSVTHFVVDMWSLCFFLGNFTPGKARIAIQ